MGYLRTILTYNVPSEAEIDKAFLESRGISVCLLNANTSRNELGAPFFVRLQVMEDDAEKARNLIKQANPQRFGSNERVNEIDRQIKRAFAGFVLIAIPVGVIVGLATYFLTVDPAHPGGLAGDHPAVHFLGLISPPMLLFAVPALAVALRGAWRGSEVEATAVAWLFSEK